MADYVVTHSTDIAPVKSSGQFQVPNQAYQFVLADRIHPVRAELEAFVSEGFARSYQAQVSSYLPVLLGMRTAQQLQAVVGIRRACRPLFVEQYLQSSVDETLQKHGIWALPNQIAEIGNLYSRSQKFTLPLLMTTVMGLYLSKVNYLVFAGTDKVRQLLRRLNMELVFLADANPACLGDKASRWGSYYNSQPKVLLLDIDKAVANALQQPHLNALFEVVKANLQQVLPMMRAA